MAGLAEMFLPRVSPFPVSFESGWSFWGTRVGGPWAWAPSTQHSLSPAPSPAETLEWRCHSRRPNPR